MSSQNDYRSNGQYDDIYSQTDSEARTSFSVDILANIIIELQRRIGHQDRFQRLITTLHQVLEYDASALLRYDPRQLIPLATDGLTKDVLGRCFALEGHPRPGAIARAGDVVCFPVGSELSDPYGGLVPRQENLKAHACAGLPLFAGQNLIGALTLDGMQPDQFDAFGDEELQLIAAPAAGALSNVLLIEQLESQNIMPDDAAPFEAMKQARMTGLSPDMTQPKKKVKAVAASGLNVLINGETGTGKELVTKTIHEASPRAVNLLVYLNYAVLPESVVENELSGYVKGASTGAISSRSGKFEMMDNGILFLDEAGELSSALRAKLLRVLQHGDIRRVGNDRSLRVDVHVLAATNRGLHEEVLAGRFRADLFHRLSMFPLSTPPLCERGDDITLLARHFYEQRHLQLGLSCVVLSTGVRGLLQHRRFPGNVHEPEHAAHWAVVLSRATRNDDEAVLGAQHLAFPEVTSPPPEIAVVPVVKQNLREATEVFQRETVRQALAQDHHDQAVCAWMLETNVANLYRLAKRLGLKD